MNIIPKEKEAIEDCVKTILRQHVGQKNALNRWGMVMEVFGPAARLPRNDRNVFDRSIRRAIETLRSQGMIICNLGDGSGWFLPYTDEEYRAFRAVYGSHAFPIMENIREMDRKAKELWENPLQPKLIP